ncbi:UDP-glucose 4-epimerase GalE, partial [Rhizobium ruizarguesonis]
LLKGGDSVALNLGTGTGTTVKELLGSIEDVSNRPFPVEYIGRREGDSHTLVRRDQQDVPPERFLDAGWLNAGWILHDSPRRSG